MFAIRVLSELLMCESSRTTRAAIYRERSTRARGRLGFRGSERAGDECEHMAVKVSDSLFKFKFKFKFKFTFDRLLLGCLLFMK